MKEGITITKIEIKDFMGLKDVQFVPKKDLNIILGANKQGKTAILKAIKAALSGADSSYIRQGADKAEILLDMGDITAKKTITHKSTKLEVVKKDGDISYAVKAPQTFLNGLIGDFSFDPIAFVTADDRKEYLLKIFNPKITKEDLENVIDAGKLPKIDYSKDGLTILKDLETVFYNHRHAVNFQRDSNKKIYEEGMSQLQEYTPSDMPDIDTLERKARDVKSQHDAAILNNNDIKHAVEKRQALHEKLKKQEGKFDEMPAEIGKEADKLRQEHDHALSVAVELNKQYEAVILHASELAEALSKKEQQADIKCDIGQEIEGLKKEIYAIEPDEPVDIESIHAQSEKINASIKDINQKQLLHVKWQSAQDTKRELEDYKAQSEELTKIIEILRKDLPEMITKKANMPITGLSFQGRDVLLDGISLDKLSSAEQIGVSIDFCKALNKDATIKFLCLDKIESLDKESMQALFEMTQNDDWQYFITVVDHGNIKKADNVFTIVDGEIKE